MKEIKLTQGEVTLVDNEDFDFLSKWKWCVSKNKGRIKRVSRTTLYSDGKQRHLSMHRLIMGLQFGDKLIVDHRDGNSLNNRKKNLRICIRAENNMNISGTARNTSGYKGVSWDETNKKWRALIQHQEKDYVLGRYNNLRDAVLAYNMAAIRHHGRFANLNILPD